MFPTITKYGKFFYRKFVSLNLKISVVFNYVRLKLSLKYLGEKVKVYSYPKIYHPEKVSIGNFCTINSQVIIGGRGTVKIGNNVRISDGVIIHSGYLGVQERNFHHTKPVVIEDNVWLASGSIINPGVTIGENSIIAAGTVVTKDVSRNSICKGVAGKCYKIENN